MKKRAILILATTLILFGTKLKTVYGQDTIVAGSFPSTESLNSMTNALGIMEEALMEQLKALDMNSDSLKYYMGLLNEQMKNLPDPFVIPDDIATTFGNNFDRDVFATTVNLKGESKTEEIVVRVKKKIPVMFLIINGVVKSGNIIVEIFDPNGMKQGSFSIENDDKNNGEVVNSSMNKSLKAPIKGKWKVKINSVNAHGNINITSMQKL